MVSLVLLRACIWTMNRIEEEDNDEDDWDGSRRVLLPGSSGVGAFFLVFAHVAQMAEADQLVAFFIPEPEGQRFEAAEEGDWLDLLEKWIGVVASFQIVIGNADAEMVNVMKTDVAGEPLENSRQLVERAALKSGRGIIPIFAAFPVNAFKLMLDVKEPESGRATDCPAHQ